MDDKEKVKVLEKENERLKKQLELRALSVDKIRETQDKLNDAIEKVNQQRRELKEHTDRYKELCNELRNTKSNYEKFVKRIIQNMKIYVRGE